MFDIGFWELVTIAVIGIVVVGPDKLPEVVRTVMGTVHKFRRMFNDVKGDIERELHLDEMRRQVEEADINEHIRQLNQSVLEAEKNAREGGKKLLDDIDRAANQTAEDGYFEDGEGEYAKQPPLFQTQKPQEEKEEDFFAEPETPPAEDFFAEPDPETHAETGIETPKKPHERHRTPH